MKIPTIGPGSTQLNTQSPNVPQEVGVSGKMMQVAGQAINETASDWYRQMDEARNYTELAQAEAADAEIIGNELLRAETAVDKMGRPRQGSVEDMEDHNEVFRQSESKIMGYFTNKEMANKYKAERQKGIMAAKNQIARKYQTNMLDAGKASVINKVSTAIQLYASAPEQAKKLYENLIKYHIDEGVKFGFLRESEAQKLQYDSNQSSRLDRFINDFRISPEDTEKKFLAGHYGMDIETSEKARVRLKQIKTIRREAEGELYNDLALKVTMGQVSDKMIDQAMADYNANSNEGITPAHGKKLKEALYRDIKTRIGVKEYIKYKKAIDFVFSSSQQDKIKGYEAILAAYTDGLTPDETNFLNKILQTKKDVIFANKAAAGKKMLEQLFGARPKDVERETKALLAYAKRIANGLDPEEAAKETATDIIKEDHPTVVANPDLAGAFSPTKGYRNIPKVKQEKK